MYTYFLVLISLSSCLAADYNVIVGAGTEDTSWFFHNYFPSELWIHPGDRVTWRLGAEVHTVTFLPRTSLLEGELPSSALFTERRDDGALVLNSLAINRQGPDSLDSPNTLASSGFMSPENPTYSLTFEEEGDYHYINLLHPTVFGTIHVVGKSKYIHILGILFNHR
jgi:plastocyanin